MSYKIGSRRAQDITSGEFEDARVKASSVVQHEEQLEAVLDLGDLQPSNVLMGNFSIQCDQDPSDSKDLSRKGYVDAEVSTEKARAEAAEGVNAAAITAEETARISGDDGEKTRAEAAEAALQVNIDAEASARTSADSALSGRLDTVEGGLVAGVVWKDSLADLAALDALTEGSVTVGWAYYVVDQKDVFVCVDSAGDRQPSGWSSKGFIKIADFTELSGLVSSEESARQSADSTLQANIDSEASSRTSADSTATSDRGAIRTEFAAADAGLQTAIDAVQADVNQNESDSDSAHASATTDRGSIRTEFAAADSTISASVTAEANTRASADTSLQSNITAEETRALAAEGVNAAAITAEASSRASADSALDARLDTLEGDSNTAGSVAKAIADVIDAAPEALDTLKELSAALGDDADFATTITGQVTTVQGNLDTFIARTDNPHSVTPAQLSLVPGTDVLAFDGTVQGLASAYHPGGGSYVPVMYAYQQGAEATVSYSEHGKFQSRPISEPIETQYLAGGSSTMYSLNAKYIILKTSGITSGTGTFELTLPALNDSMEGRVYVFKGDGMQDAGGNDVDIKLKADASDTIDGGADFEMNDTYQSIFLLATKNDGWMIV